MPGDFSGIQNCEDFDACLLRRIAKKDREAFDVFYRRHGGRVAQILRGSFHLTEDLSDVVQDVFMQVWVSAARYDSVRGPVAAWLLIITRSRALDLLRKRKRTGEVGRAEPTECAERQSDVAPIEILWVRHALNTLPVHHRSMLRLAYCDGFSHSQLARKLHRPLGTVKTQIRASLKLLREAADGRTARQSVRR